MGRAPITHPLGIPPIGDQAGLLQCRHMARHARLTGTDELHQLADAMFLAVPQHPHRGQSSGFGKGGEDVNGVFHRVKDTPMRICGKEHISCIWRMAAEMTSGPGKRHDDAGLSVVGTRHRCLR